MKKLVWVGMILSVLGASVFHLSWPTGLVLCAVGIGLFGWNMYDLKD